MSQGSNQQSHIHPPASFHILNRILISDQRLESMGKRVGLVWFLGWDACDTRIYSHGRVGEGISRKNVEFKAWGCHFTPGKIVSFCT